MNLDDFMSRLGVEPPLPEIRERARRITQELKNADDEALKIKDMINNAGLADFYKMPPVNGLTVLALCSMLDDESMDKVKHKLGKTAAEARHREGNADKAKALKEWDIAGGRYTSRAAFARNKCKEYNVTTRTLEKWIGEYEKTKK